MKRNTLSLLSFAGGGGGRERRLRRRPAFRLHRGLATRRTRPSSKRQTLQRKPSRHQSQPPGRIGAELKKLVFNDLENNEGFAVSLMSYKTTALEAGSKRSEAVLHENDNARKILLTFVSQTGIPFSSVTFYYTCGNAV